MANLLGPQQIIITPSNSFVLSETQFIGAEGYTREIASRPQIGLTSNGNINYKQDSTIVPMHVFSWNIVMPKEDAYRLITDIETQILSYKNNNDRNLVNFLLEDRKLAVVVEALPVGTPTFSLTGSPSNEWVFATWKIIVNSISYEIFGVNKLKLVMQATQII